MWCKQSLEIELDRAECFVLLKTKVCQSHWSLTSQVGFIKRVFCHTVKPSDAGRRGLKWQFRAFWACKTASKVNLWCFIDWTWQPGNTLWLTRQRTETIRAPFPAYTTGDGYYSRPLCCSKLLLHPMGVYLWLFTQRDNGSLTALFHKLFEKCPFPLGSLKISQSWCWVLRKKLSVH